MNPEYMAINQEKGIIRPLDTGPFPQTPSGKNFLLAIAIDQYDYCPRLSNCVKDAGDFASLLKERYAFDPENIITLYNQEATRRNILAYLKELKTRVKDQDNLVIFFSGHGETQGDVGYWVPVEAHPDQEWEFVSTLDIKSYLDSINSFHTFVIVDACFSGSLFSTYRSVNTGLETHRSRWGLAASHSRERALDGTPGENSPFAEKLLKTLRDSTENIGVQKLAADVIERVLQATQGRQTPVFKPLDIKGDDSGQYVFHLKASEASLWEACRQASTAAALRQFLQKFPEGQFAGAARRYLEELEEEELWKTAVQTNSIPAFYDYLKNHRDGRHAREAREQIRSIEDQDAWENAERIYTLSAYDDYLTRFPDGLHEAEARAKVQAILKEERQPVKRKEEEPLKPPLVVPREPEDKQVKTTARKPATGKEIPKSKKWIPYVIGSLAVIILTIWGILQIPPSPGNLKEKPALVVFESAGKFGYRSPSGQVIIPPQFDAAAPFKDGQARVTRNLETFTINESGACIADCPVDRYQEAWKQAERLNNINAYKAFLHEFPTGQYAAEARKRITDLEAGTPVFDGRTYRTVNILGLTWLAENLNIQIAGSWCYGNDPANCDRFGRLYTWDAAHRACKALGPGWRLPSADEWQSVTGHYGPLGQNSEQVFEALSPGGISGLNLLAGGRWQANQFGWLNEEGAYWSSTEWSDGTSAWHLSLSRYPGRKPLADGGYPAKETGLSCRCVK